MSFRPRNIPLVVMCIALAVLIASFHQRAWIMLVLAAFAVVIMAGIWVSKVIERSWKEDEKQGRDKE